MKLIFLVLILLLSDGYAEAVTRYADATLSAGPCSNYNPATRLCSGGSDTAYGTTNALRLAIAGRGAGDIVEVRGTGEVYAAVGDGYQSGVKFPSGSAIAFLTVQGYQSERPIVRGVDHNGSDGSPTTYVQLKNLSINCNAVRDSIGLTAFHRSRAENVEITNCGGGGISNMGNSSLISMNVWNNGFNCSSPPGQCHGAYSGGPTGYAGFIAENIIVDGGEYHHNAGIGLQCYTVCGASTIKNAKFHHNGSYGLLTCCNTGTIAYNLLIYDNGHIGFAVISPNIVVSNVTSWRNLSQGICVDRDGATIRNALVVGNLAGQQIDSGCFDGITRTITQVTNHTTFTGTGAHHFADAVNGDFRLCRIKGDPTANCLAASSAIGAATQLNSIFTTDIVGATRGAVWDAGAYESTSVLTPTVVVTAPTSTGTYSASTSPLSISGTFQSGAPLTSVTWSNSLGGSGTATGTSNWTIPAVSLTVGVNTITITGTDANNLTGQTTLVVTYAPGSLVGAWSCDEGAGTTVADASGNSNNGTFTSAGWNVSGKFSSACSFNGSTSVVTVADANSLDLQGGGTLQAWVYPTVQTSAWRALFSKSYYLFSSSSDVCGTSNLYGGFVNNDIYYTTCYSVPLPINTWTFVTLRMDGSSVNIYTGTTPADFALRSSLSATQTMVVNADPLLIGNSAAPLGEPFAGLLDNMRIYNYARSAVAGSGACGLGYSELQCDMIAAINPSAAIIIQLNVTALQLGPGVVLEMGAAP